MDTIMNVRSFVPVLCVCTLAFIVCVPFARSQVPSDRDVLLGGAESGQQRPAEINGFPGPGRLLELEKELHLTDAQKKSLRAISGETRTRAIELGKRIIGIEEELNDAFRTGLVSEQSIRDDAEQIGRLRGKLRAVHLASHLKARKILTPEQISACRNLKSKEQAPKR